MLIFCMKKIKDSIQNYIFQDSNSIFIKMYTFITICIYTYINIHTEGKKE